MVDPEGGFDAWMSTSYDHPQRTGTTYFTRKGARGARRTSATGGPSNADAGIDSALRGLPWLLYGHRP